MLVLTRKQDESIVIDGQITIRVLHLRGNRIRLGIDAPRDMPVRRGELTILLPEDGQPVESTPATADSIAEEELVATVGVSAD